MLRIVLLVLPLLLAPHALAEETEGPTVDASRAAYDKAT